MPISAARPPLQAGSVSLDGMHVDLQWHFHDMHKLLCAFEGAIEVESTHGRHLVPRQLAAWIPAGVPHCTSIHGIRWVSVFFPPKMLNDPERRVRTLMVSGLMREMLREAMRAYTEADARVAETVIARDDEVDHLYARGIEALQDEMQADSGLVRAGTIMLFVLANVERVGDRAQNIAWHTKEMLGKI